MTLKPKINHPNGSVLKSQDRKTHVMFGQMWKFCSLFSSIAMAWCIMNSCRKVVRSIRNTILKLWIIMDLHYDNAPAHTSMLVRMFLGQKQNLNHASITVFTANFFLFPKLNANTDERKAFCYDWGDKRKIETGAVGDTRKGISEVFRVLEKLLA